MYNNVYNFSQFGCFDANETVVEMENQMFYKNDSFGLRTLASEGKLETITLSGFDHYDWHLNLTYLEDYILPHLD